MNWMSSVFFKVCLFGFIGLACPTALLKAEGIIKGTVLDKNSGEPVIGAAVMLEQTLKGLVTDCVSPTTSYHRLLRGLPGYLILFAPHAFVPQRQI